MLREGGHAVFLGDAINKARVDKRLGLRALARQLEIAPSYLSDIENNRRVPSETVLLKMSQLLDLDFDMLMQQAGRLGEDAEQYLRQHQLAGQLFRRIAKSQLDPEVLNKLLTDLDNMERQEGNEG